jgi:hypothetical protein
MNIKICLPPRKRPMTLEDLPDMSALVPVGSLQQVVAYGAEEWTVGVIESAPHKPYDNSAERQRTANGWGEWQIGKDFAANLAKFEVEVPWTLEEVRDERGSFTVINFDPGHDGFRVEYIAYSRSCFDSVDAALDYALAAPRYACIIVNEDTRERVLEVTP